LKFSQASNKIADGDVDPGLKTDTLDAETTVSNVSGFDKVSITWNFLYKVTCVGGDHSDSVNLCDCKGRASIEVSRSDIRNGSKYLRENAL
jgi:hypothetical protein